MKTDPTELIAKGPAGIVSAAVKAAIPTATDPEIKAHMIAYRSFLIAQDRDPQASDYIEPASIDDYNSSAPR
jgi:hypothetical protein